MALPNTLLPRILHLTEISDEEFYTTGRMLVRKLIRRLGRNPADAVNVVAFLMWLERDRMSVNAVYKVLVDWPAHLVDMVADQVVALLEWLNNPTMVWERRGDISMIQELCRENLAFVQLHERRLEILEGKRLIVIEMSERAFRNAFPNVRDEGGISAGGVGVQDIGGGGGFQFGSVGGYVNHPRGLERTGGVVRFAAGPVYAPREPVNNGVQSGGVSGGLVHDSRQLENIGARFAVGVPVPQTYRTLIGYPPTINPNVFRLGTVSDFVQEHPVRENMNRGDAGGLETVGGLNMKNMNRGDAGGLETVGGLNMNGGGVAGDFETVGRLVQGHGIPENMDGAGFGGGYGNESSSNNGQILPGVPFGPRMGYVDTSGHTQRSEVNIQPPIPEEELSSLLRGLNIQEEEIDVHEDDRTIFLTFSRGYPITEPEIWGYFTRRFGNFIKGIHFEEVPEGEQPLYARMVARNTSILPLICDVHIRTKYVINGKHAWAKKYLRNNNAHPRIS